MKRVIFLLLIVIVTIFIHAASSITGQPRADVIANFILVSVLYLITDKITKEDE